MEDKFPTIFYLKALFDSSIVFIIKSEQLLEQKIRHDNGSCIILVWINCTDTQISSEVINGSESYQKLAQKLSKTPLKWQNMHSGIFTYSQLITL